MKIKMRIKNKNIKRYRSLFYLVISYFNVRFYDKSRLRKVKIIHISTNHEYKNDIFMKES